MARLILGVTGSVAAVRTPALFRAFVAAGHEVRVVATRPALYFFDPAEIGADRRRIAGHVPRGSTLHRQRRVARDRLPP